ncbi:U2 snRNP complex subunit [Ceratocystis pirilliformis]|uniref:U2 small nuclear ribonucleoprotein A' n=1 Tax=Ceratocystis pirilliformis TaxID=259994 RepID=A0ABR3ZJG1_9PEZI
MRLTPDLIKSSLSYLNPLKERELDLRGHRIPNIENIGVAGPHDSIDFTDNDIQTLGNFPLSPRLTTLLLARNRISSIQPTVANSIPSLRSLVLASNNLQQLADIEPLGGLKLLTHLTLVDNPITKHEHYRYWVVWKCPSVRFLDYQKVKQAERDRAVQLFGTEDEPTALTTEILGNRSTAPSASSEDTSQTSKLTRMKLTEKENLRLQDMIKNATTLQEIIRLEKILSEGRLPPGFHLEEDDVMAG